MSYTYDIVTTSDAPDRSDAEVALKAAAETIRKWLRVSSEHIIAIGRQLTAAKRLLKRGEFSSWVSVECGLTLRTAQNYMRASNLVELKGETIAHLSPASIYRLAERKTPPEVVDRVLELLRGGNVPTEPDIEAMIKRACQTSSETSEISRTSDERAAQLASDLRLRLGDTMVRELIDGPWEQIGICLRLQLDKAESQLTFAEGDRVDSQRTAKVIFFPSNAQANEGDHSAKGSDYVF
jgi:Protein of unknown function (DUF3102)